MVPSERVIVPSSDWLTPLLACGVPLTATGGHAAAHVPVHADVPPLSASNRYIVRPWPSTRALPGIPEMAARLIVVAAAPLDDPLGAALLGRSAVALILVTSCASAGGSAHGVPGGGSSSSPLPPRQALLAAATEANRINSAVETISVQDRGASTSTMTGTFRYQLKPTVEASADFHTDIFGMSTQMKAIAPSDAVYFNMGARPGLPDPGHAAGKPWIKVDLSSLNGSGMAGFAQLVQGTQSGDFTAQAHLFAVAENVHVAGTQVIDGVPTTEYDGSFRVAAALEALPASLHKVLAVELQALGTGPVYFREWIDGQHHVRTMIEVHTVDGAITTSPVLITAFNEPVAITLPPASQVVTEFIL